jgi:hypothetical protein
MSRGFLPSEAELNLEGKDDLRVFFTNHIANSLADGRGRIAKFKNINPKDPSGICAGILEGSTDFVEGTTQIAQRLYEILHDGRTKEADLAIAQYEAKNFPKEQFIALLKIDPAQVFEHEFIEVDGKLVVNYKPLINAFTDQKLQKCAFIQSIEPKRHPDYDMVLLDPKSKEVAQYFKDKLLDCEESYDAKIRTRKLWQSFVQAGNLISDRLGPEEVDEFEQQREAAMRRTSINYENFINTLDLSEDDKEDVQKIFSSRLPDRDFEIDQDYVEKIAKKRIFTGKYGLRVQVDSQYYNQVIELGDEIVEEGKVVGRKIILHARDWQEVSS